MNHASDPDWAMNRAPDPDWATRRVRFKPALVILGVVGIASVVWLIAGSSAKRSLPSGAGDPIEVP